MYIKQTQFLGWIRLIKVVGCVHKANLSQFDIIQLNSVLKLYLAVYAELCVPVQGLSGVCHILPVAPLVHVQWWRVHWWLQHSGHTSVDMTPPFSSVIHWGWTYPVAGAALCWHWGGTTGGCRWYEALLKLSSPAHVLEELWDLNGEVGECT